MWVHRKAQGITCAVTLKQEAAEVAEKIPGYRATISSEEARGGLLLAAKVLDEHYRDLGSSRGRPYTVKEIDSDLVPDDERRTKRKKDDASDDDEVGLCVWLFM